VTVSPLPELDLDELRRFCAEQWPEEFKDEVRLEVRVRGSRVSVDECRPAFDGAPGEWTSTPVAQPRYDEEGLWTLYYADSNSRWQLYSELEPRQPIAVIIAELDEDPTCIFWG